MNATVKNRLGKRLKIIEGQVRGLQRLVDKEAYCIDVITQSSAAREALSSFEDAMLENHLSTHVVHQMKNGSHGKAIAEILAVFKKSKKR